MNIYVNMLRRSVSLLLAILLSTAIFSLIVSASGEGEEAITVGYDRYLTNKIKVKDGEAAVTEDGYLQIDVNEKSPKVSMDITPIEAKTEANSLRICIANQSDCSSVTLEYTYKNSANVSETEKKDFVINAHSGIYPHEYIVPVTSPDTIKSVSLCFNDPGNGNITLVSLGAVSSDHEGTEYVGSLEQSTFEPGENKGIFAGRVSYETTIAHPDANVVLYRLDSDEDISDVRPGRKYIAVQPMTLNFRFEFEANSLSEKISRYFAAVLTKDNDIIPLTYSTYLNSKENNNTQPTEKDGFKGCDTEMYAWAVENGSSLAIVDVHLDRINNKDEIGYQYVVDGKEYYFDRDIIDKIDLEIKHYSDIGCDVYVRFLIDADRIYTNEYNGNIASATDEVKYIAVDTRYDSAAENLFAAADFLFSRYSGKATALKGVIPGRAIDRMNEYNFVADVSMRDYSDIIARTVSILDHAIIRNSLDLSIVLPVSDKLFSAEKIVTAENRDEIFYSDMLLDAIYSCLTRYGVSVEKVQVMLESMHSPFEISDNGGETVFNVVGDKYINAYNLDPIEHLLTKLSAQYGNVNKQIIFNFCPGEEVNLNDFFVSYIYNYNLLASKENVGSYIVSFENVSKDTENERISAIRNAYKYIDTDKNQEASKLALDIIGASDWKELMPGYKDDQIVRHELIEKDLTYNKDTGIRGSYCLWDFENANGTLDWSAFTGCEYISVLTPSDSKGRAMVANMLNGSNLDNGAMFGSIIYHAPDVLYLENIHSLSFEIFIPGVKNTEDSSGIAYEIIVKVVGDEKITESKGRVFSGHSETVYANISEIDKVRYVMFSVRSLDTESKENYSVYINGISIHSGMYTSNELEDIVMSGEIGNTSDTVKNDNFDGIFVVGFSVIIGILAVSVVWMAHAIKIRFFD